MCAVWGMYNLKSLFLFFRQTPVVSHLSNDVSDLLAKFVFQLFKSCVCACSTLKSDIPPSTAKILATPNETTS